jgi:hypothetical protein
VSSLAKWLTAGDALVKGAMHRAGAARSQEDLGDDCGAGTDRGGRQIGAALAHD